MATDDLASTLRARAEQHPDRTAFGFLDRKRDVTLTYGELDMQARRIASILQNQVPPGGRAMLVHDQNLSFLTAFFGCLYAGIVAVPVCPPAAWRLEAGLAQVLGVLRDARPHVVLAGGRTEWLAGVAAARSGTAGPPWIETDAPGDGDATAWRDPGVRPSWPAFIQYTSGSTSDPKGVVIRHADLLANQRSIDSFLRMGDDGIMVSWLPLYHDMGLIGCALHPLYRGVPSYLMAPLQFLHRPLRWLQAISRLRATVSGAPNFAYELCVRTLTQEDLTDLDLTSWQVAFNGAEPIRAGTVRRFAHLLEPCGLRPLAQLGCYGLAEASLLVSGARWGDPPFLTVDRADLEKGVVTVREPGPGALELVSSGRVQAHHEVRIVDRQTCEEVHDGQVGEIWFRGPSVGAGYWNRTEETTTTFGATLRGDGDRPFLRTGDAGFLHGGQLFVTGRTKDLLIVRGRNLHPEDIEEAAQRSDPRLRPGSAVAFPLQTGEEDAIALLQETTEEDGAALRQLAAGVRRAVTAAVGARVSTIYLVRRRSVLRTSSGKIRRRATQAALEAGRVAVLHVDADTAPSLGMEMA